MRTVLVPLCAVLASATLLSACGNGGAIFGDGSCEVDGRIVADGESFGAGDGCNSCSCDDGEILCTLAECLTGCDDGNSFREVGESWNDGCNDCFCDESGFVSCTDAYCGPFDCTYLGETKPAGSSFPARDGCNTCTCEDDGTAACTELLCMCDADAEWWRSYSSEVPSTCAVIDLDCPDNTIPFTNECGCGCEQDVMCAEQYDCRTMGCAIDHLRETCPYSEILE